MILRTKLTEGFVELKANPSRPVTDEADVKRLIQLLDQRGPEDGRQLADLVEVKDFCLPVEFRFMLRDPLLPNGGPFNGSVQRVDLPKFTEEANLWDWVMAEAERYRAARLVNSAFEQVPQEYFPIRAYGIWLHELHGKLVIEHTEVVKALNYRELDHRTYLVLNGQGKNEVLAQHHATDRYPTSALAEPEQFPALMVENDFGGLEFIPNTTLKGLHF